MTTHTFGRIDRQITRGIPVRIMTGIAGQLQALRKTTAFSQQPVLIAMYIRFGFDNAVNQGPEEMRKCITRPECKTGFLFYPVVA